MAVIDLYTGQQVVTGNSPSTENRDQGGDFNYYVSMSKEDVLIICTGGYDGLTLQTDDANDIEVELSNFPCNITGQIIVGNVPVDGGVPNPNTQWFTLGNKTTTAAAVDTTGYSQMRITAQQDIAELSITVSPEAPVNAGFVTPGNGGVPVPLDVNVINTPLDVNFLIYKPTQREDNTPAGKVEYTELVSIDQAGNVAGVSRFLADGTPYVPIGTAEFKSAPACCVDVKEDVNRFRVSGGMLVTLVENPVDGTLFHDDDNDPTGKGIIFEISSFLTSEFEIASVNWDLGSVGAGGDLSLRLSDNQAMGAFGANNAERLSKPRIFIRTHTGGGPIVGILNYGRAYVEDVEGNIFSSTFFSGQGTTSGPNDTTEAVFSCAMFADEGSAPGEIVYKLVTYQPNKPDVLVPTDMVVNRNPISAGSSLGFYSDSCNTNAIVLPVPFGTPYNDAAPFGFPSCSTSVPYTSNFFDMPWNLGPAAFGVLLLGTDTAPGNQYALSYGTILPGGLTTYFSYNAE